MTLENVKKTVFLILLLIITLKVNASDDHAEYIKYTKEIINPFIQECEKKYQLNCIGTGGRFAKNIAGIDIKFIAYRKGTIEESRELEVKMIEKLLSQINNHEKIRPFLIDYPFREKDIIISISFRKPDNDYYKDSSIAYVSHIKSKLFYDIHNPKTDQLLDFFEESYEEALKIVNGKSLEIK